MMVIALKQIGLRKRDANLFADCFRLGCRFQFVLAQVFKHHDEFIAAQARHRVAIPNTSGQSLRGLL